MRSGARVTGSILGSEALTLRSRSHAAVAADETANVNRIATGLLGVISLTLIGAGSWLVFYWLSRPIFAAGEMAGVAIGVLFLVAGVGAAFAARGVLRDRRGAWIWAVLLAVGSILLGWSTLGTYDPPPVLLAVSIGWVAAGIALAILAVARAAGRAAP